MYIGVSLETVRHRDVSPDRRTQRRLKTNTYVRAFLKFHLKQTPEYVTF